MLHSRVLITKALPLTAHGCHYSGFWLLWVKNPWLLFLETHFR